MPARSSTSSIGFAGRTESTGGYCAAEFLASQDGIFAGYTGVDIDITDLRRAQERGSCQAETGESWRLTTGIAHDFNNLLGGILASVELAIVTFGVIDDEDLVRIRTAAIRGGEIVRQLMIYGGVESQVLESVDISLLVGEMLELLKVSISKCPL
jgi:hypothetical protein